MAKKKAIKKKAAKTKTSKAPAKASVAGKKSAVKPARVVPEGPRKFDKVTATRTKSQVVETLSLNTGLSKKEVKIVFETLKELIGNDLKKGGPGVFNLPGLLKVKVVNKPATKARKGISPFSGEPMTFKAKPARNIIKIRPLKALKEMV